MAASIENLVAKIKTLPVVKQRSISALLGATVADAATRPLHWMYNQDILNNVIGSKDPEFWPESKSPFYKIPLGQPSAYNDTALACLTSLNENNSKVDIKHICESFKKHFGVGSDYADALARRSVKNHPEKKSDFVGPVEGPWIQQAMKIFLENYEKGQGEHIGGPECNEQDGFCAALPAIALYAGKEDMWIEAEKLTSLLSTHVETTKMFHAEALLVNNFILGKNNVIEETKNTMQSSYPNVHELMIEAEEAKSLPYISSVAKFGRACSLPGSFQGGLLTMLHASSFVDAVRLNITAGGCNCGRANFIGACYGAKYGIDGIPLDWLAKVINIEKITEMAINVISVSA